MRPLATHLAPALLALTTLAPAAAARQAVWTVDDDAPADFADVQPAVDAAADGDLILVRPGDYGHATIDGKALTLQVDGPDGSAVLNAPFPFFQPVAPALAIRGLASQQSVVVRGFTTWSLGLVSTESALAISDCAGPVLVENCTITLDSGVAVTLAQAASVTFTRSEIDAGTSFYDEFIPLMQPQTGLSAAASTVYLYDSSVRGSLGPDAVVIFSYHLNGEGGPACVLTGATLFASGSMLIGGDGGSGIASVCAAGENGGDAVAFDAASVVRLLDSELVGGTGGTASPGCGLPDGLPGVELDGPAGAVQELPGAARSLASGSPVVEATQVVATLVGQPGDVALLVLAFDPTAAIWYDALAVAQHVAAPFAVLPVGAVPASGELALSFPIPALPAGVAFLRHPAQALFLASGGQVFHSGPSTVVIKDQAL